MLGVKFALTAAALLLFSASANAKPSVRYALFIFAELCFDEAFCV